MLTDLRKHASINRQASPSARTVIDPQNSTLQTVATTSFENWTKQSSSSAATLIDPRPRLTNETLGQNSRCYGHSIRKNVLTKLSPQSAKYAAASTLLTAVTTFTADSMSSALTATLFAQSARKRLTSPLPNWAFGSINEGVRVGVVSYIHIHVGRDKDAKMFDDPRFIPVNDAEQKLGACAHQARHTLSPGRCGRHGQPDVPRSHEHWTTER